MISKTLYALSRALGYVKQHPQLAFVLILLVAFPLLFLYSGQQFLDVGRANQERLQLDRVGVLHDVLASLLTATDFDVVVAGRELAKIADLNQDIVNYSISRGDEAGLQILVQKTEVDANSDALNTDFYRSAAVDPNESIIFETQSGEELLWNAYRAVVADDGSLYFIYTQTSLRSIDMLFAEREQSAYFSLIFIYAFIIALALWHVQLTDYRYLYISAKKANETKDLFTNMIAHELRAPLTAIRGYATMIDERTTNQEERLYAQRVGESAERLLSIVNDLLDVARIQSGKIQVVSEDVDVARIVTAVKDELAISAQEKKITLNFEPPSTPTQARGDAKRLHQVLTNLVSNAIKYTPEGSITLSIESKTAYVEVRVQDTGMGISSEDQKKLFAPFFRVASTDVSKITGSGLGMWIAKELVELMGGKIGVESIKGVGTHIVLSVPKEYSLKQS